MDQRRAIACSAADRLEGLARAGALGRALVGFDGFVDHIKHMVASRTSMAPREYTRIRTIDEFAARCAGAAGKSTNVEQVLLESRFGGNGPLMARALASLGVRTTYIGAVGDGSVEPAFEGFARRCEAIFAICPSSRTDCLEFDDGKLMFNDTGNVQGVTWDLVVERVGLARLGEIVGRSALVGIVNWSLLGGVDSIWRGLMRHVLPGLGGQRRMFVDLSDPAKRTDADIGAMLGLLGDLARTPGLVLTLGLNLAEAQRIARVAGLSPLDDSPGGEEVAGAAGELRARLGLDCVVVHPRQGAASASGHAAWFDGPLTAHPRLSTGAGDHFNAGFALAQTHGLAPEQCLACGVATSGVYVRDARSPSLARLCEFLRALPPPAEST